MKRDIYKSMFYNQDGSLNDHSLACGYIEKSDINDIYITLEKEHNCYQVKGFNHNSIGFGRCFWNTYDHNELIRARKFFYKMIKQYQNINKKSYLKNAI